MNTKRILLLLLLLVPLAGVLCLSATGDVPETGAPALPYTAPSYGEEYGNIPLEPVEQDGSLASLPLVFIQNAGQFRNDILFMVISDAGPVSFERDGSALRVVSPEDGKTAFLGYRFEGVSDGVAVEGVDQLACEANFLTGSDQSQWITGVDTFRALRYVNLYPGIDLLYEGVSDGLKSTYTVRPGSDPGAITIEYYGQDDLSVAPEGTLLLTTAAGTITHSAPYCYQVIDGTVVEVSSGYTLTGQGRVGFAVGDYDRDYDLIIDPVLKYGLYLKGIGMADAHGVAVDTRRNAYVTGKSFPTPYDAPPGSSGTNAGGTDVIVIKINPDGTVPLYITYLGGNGDESGNGIRVDNDGGAYVVGTTNSTDFPVANPLQATLAGQNDAFITRLAPNGTSLVYSTYMGGINNDYGYAIARDGVNNVYITGSTESPSFIVPSTYQRTTRGGLTDAYLIKISPNGGELIDKEYIGGKIMETGYGIAVDQSGNAYITGETFSWDFPVKNAAYPNFSGYSDAFVTKIAPSGDPISYSTYIGGSDMDGGRAIDVDSDGSAHITGLTRSKNFPVKDAFKPVSPGLISSFYSSLEPSGNALVLSTYLTGPGFDEGRGIAVTPTGSVYITGITKATNMQLIDPFQPKYGGGVSDAFVAKFVTGESYPAYLTYLGGSDKEEGYGIATDGICGAYIVGLTWSSDLPASDPYPPDFIPAGKGGFIVLLWDDAICCSPPVADFKADPSGGYAPLTVQFTDLSTGEPDSWLWQFGEGNTSEEQNPLYTYTEVGNYTVTLTVANPCGEDQTSGEISVLCLEPVAGFIANPDSGYAPLTVQFTDISLNNVISWSWEFGDGNTSTEQNPLYTYTEVGNYTVNLTVENSCGTDETSGQVVVGCLEPVAGFIANPDSGYAPLTVQFTDISLNNVISWSWEFGDGNTSTEQNPLYTYTAVGNYTVNLTVENSCGTDETSGQVVVGCLEPVAGFIADPDSGYAPLTVQFTDTSLNNVISWSWEFGDGNTSTEQNPLYTYTAVGNYTVNLTVENSCGTDETSGQVVVGCLEPVAGFIADPEEGRPPLTVQFTDTSQNNVTLWSWEFGDGNTSTEQNPLYTYTAVGNYTVNLTVENNCGTDSTSRIIRVLPCIPPVADFTANQTTGHPPLTVQFYDLSTQDPTEWYWEFGTGATSTEQNPIYTYTQIGTYTVNLTVWNECGNDSISKIAFVVTVPCTTPHTTVPTTIPTTVPTTEPTTIPTTCPTTVPTTEPTTIPTTCPTTEPTTEPTTIPTTCPTTEPTTEPTTIPTTCPTTCTTPVPPLPPHIFYGAVTLMGEPAPVETTITTVVEGGSGSLITDTEGYYGGEGASDDKLLVQGYIYSGTPISFYVNGYRAECYDVEEEGPWQWTYPFTSGEVTELDLRVTEGPLEPPVASFSANTTSGNVPLTVGFTDDSLNNPTSWSWDFGDNESSIEQDPVHIYTGEGNYTVNLTVINDAGNDTMSRLDYISVTIPEPLPPVAEFTANRTSGPAPLDIGFTDNSLNNPTSWSWDFGDGNTSITQNPVHTYSEVGTFTVNLTATNDYGDSSISKPEYISVTTPAEFYYINASAGAGGVINPGGLIEIPAGGTMTFNFTALTYYRIQNIQVDGVSRGVLYIYTFEDVYANHTITALFTSATSGGGGGGGGGGGPVVTTTSPTTVPTTPTVLTGGVSDGEDTGGVVTTPTTEAPSETPIETMVTTPIPTTTVPPAQPFWAQFPLAWLIPIILVIIILAALAYYYYQKEKGEELFEEE